MAQLLMGIELVPLVTATPDLPPAWQRDAAPPTYQHEVMTFQHAPNLAGEAKLHPSKRPGSKRKAPPAETVSVPPSEPDVNPPSTTTAGVPEASSSSSTSTPSSSISSSSTSTIPSVTAPVPPPAKAAALVPASAAPVSKSTLWYRQRAAEEDRLRMERGEPPVKRNRRRKDFYACGKCGKPKTKDTGHTQVRGKWFCPFDPDCTLSLSDWKASFHQ